MSLAELAFFAFALFVLHEFEEIIRVCPWIHRHEGDARYVKDLWLSRSSAYPTTEAIAALIAEEIVLVVLVFGAAILFDFASIVVAMVTVNCLHLSAHAVGAVRIRAWNPGSVTAVVTLPLNIGLIVAFLAGSSAKSFSVVHYGIAVVICSVLAGANLALLHSKAPRVAKIISRPRER